MKLSKCPILKMSLSQILDIILRNTYLKDARTKILKTTFTSWNNFLKKKNKAFFKKSNES